MKTNIFLALRYLSGFDNRKGFSIFTLISILSIIVGIAALLPVNAIITGMHDGYKMKTISMQTFHLVISDQFGDMDNYTEIVNQINDMDGIDKAFEVIEGPILFKIPGRNSEASIVRAFGKDYFQSKSFTENIKIEKGDIKSIYQEGKVAIGSEFKKLYGLSDKEIVGLVSVENRSKPKVKPTQLGVQFKTGYYPLDTGVIITSIPLAQELFSLDNKVNKIGILVNNVNHIETIKKKLLESLSPGLRVQAWYQIDRNMYAALKNEKTIMFFIVFLIIIVAAFNMISSLIMVVLNKKKEIGILKAIGFTPTDIKQIFISYGTIIGLFGTINGVLLGVLIANNIDAIFQFTEIIVNTFLHFYQSIINLFNPMFYLPEFQIFSTEVYYFDKVPVSINYGEIFLIMIVSMFLIFISSYVPASKAASVKPKEVIHNE